MSTRGRTRTVRVGAVTIGGGAPVIVQSMTNTKTEDVAATTAQIRRLVEAGCEIVRLAVPHEAAARALKQIRQETDAPLVADIHFDYRLAFAAIEAGVDKLRINPGNIGSPERVRAVADAAGSMGIPIRIGVNAGSLERDLWESHGGPTPRAMLESAKRQISVLEGMGFKDTVISLKSSDVVTTVTACQLAAEELDYPLHLGVTEAGTPTHGAVRSAVGIGALLLQGIGDTIRVSLTGDPVREVEVGHSILEATGLRRRGARVISCPTCGRTNIDVETLARAVEERLQGVSRPLTVAVMGCAVNGPGEAREADLGIAGGMGEGLLFKGGKALRKVPEGDLLDALISELQNLGYLG